MAPTRMLNEPSPAATVTPAVEAAAPASLSIPSDAATAMPAISGAAEEGSGADAAPEQAALAAAPAAPANDEKEAAVPNAQAAPAPALAATKPEFQVSATPAAPSDAAESVAARQLAEVRCIMIETRTPCRGVLL